MSCAGAASDTGVAAVRDASTGSSAGAEPDSALSALSAVSRIFLITSMGSDSSQVSQPGSLPSAEGTAAVSGFSLSSEVFFSSFPEFPLTTSSCFLSYISKYLSTFLRAFCPTRI